MSQMINESETQCVIQKLSQYRKDTADSIRFKLFLASKLLNDKPMAIEDSIADLQSREKIEHNEPDLRFFGPIQNRPLRLSKSCHNCNFSVICDNVQGKHLLFKLERK